jgi:uroporphyrinogen decarboxylase
MKPRERVLCALRHERADRVPRFEIWIDAFVDELGGGDRAAAYVRAGQDGILLPSQVPAQSNAWRDGVDEWGRVWREGIYAGGVVKSEADLERYRTPPAYADLFFDPAQVAQVRARYPDHCLFYGTHVGPFTAAYMAIGFERFFTCLLDDRTFVHRVLADRTEWCIALYRRAVQLGAELLVLGEDAGHRGGPMISPGMWREHVMPYHRQITGALDAPVLWHSDGDVEALLPMAAEAGFVGVHGLEPASGVDLARVRRAHPELVLVGNVDVGVLSRKDPAEVRAEVARCVDQGGRRGYMIATCNSIYPGMRFEAVAELFRSEEELGACP